MTESDIKVFLVNLTTLGISMSTIETTLKILLLVVSIGYTLNRWYELRKEKNEEDL